MYFSLIILSFDFLPKGKKYAEEGARLRILCTYVYARALVYARVHGSSVSIVGYPYRDACDSPAHAVRCTRRRFTAHYRFHTPASRSIRRAERRVASPLVASRLVQTRQDKRQNESVRERGSVRANFQPSRGCPCREIRDTAREAREAARARNDDRVSPVENARASSRARITYPRAK